MDAKEQRWNPEDYARNSAAQLQLARELIAKLTLDGDESLVDIGCGDGKIAAELARRLHHGKILGIDASQGMVELARASFPRTQHPNLEFRRMDATALRLPRVFDVAFSNATLHWIRDHLAVLRGLHRCLRPGGRLLFQMGGRGNARELVAAVQSVVTAPRWRAHFAGFRFPYHFYGVEEYEAWLPTVGFRARRIELLPRDMRHDSADALKGWLRTTWFPYTDRLPAELREAFLDEVVATYTAAHPVDREGRTHVRLMRLEVEAVAL